ncbi:MAG: hypothetical protein E7668_05635 [Ruminococcaceae bacterium]|nr:hypothetical protein [Oscillospiraceae bacterium]
MNWNGWMANVALAIRDNGTYEPFSGEAWRYAGEMTLLGMGMIFAVLAILWGVLAIFKVIFAGKTPKAPKEKAPKAKTETPAAVSDEPSDEVKAVLAATVRAVQEDDAATVAVLTAAVAAYRAQEGTDGAFRVVSFRRTGGRAWNAKR